MIEQDKNSIFQSSIGEVVKAWRETRNLTMTELAQRSGATITKGYISQLEHNKVRQPSDDHLVRIAAALNIPVLYLVTRQLPDEISVNEQKEIEVEEASSGVATAEQEGGFTFGSPLPLPGQNQMEEEEELQEILAQLDELRRRVKRLIVKKGRHR
jgi:transcriptional regulator with XRE-family HTH domain